MLNSTAIRKPGPGKYSLWRLDASTHHVEITIPIYLAYCGIVAALRHHLRTKGASLAVLAVGNADAIESYVQAARLLLRQTNERHEHQESFVGSISNKKKDRPTELQMFRRGAASSKGIIICTRLEEADEELKLFADVVAVIPSPTPRQIVATFRRFGHTLSASEQQLIGCETWTRLVYAFQPDRAVLLGLRRLREFAERTSIKTTEASAGGPTLTQLHGLDEAQQWGLELARDLDDYRKGLIKWDEVDAGLLISGPPGTGKTRFAEALAKTCHVPIVAGSAAQWQSAGYLNDFLREMRAAFAEAESKAPSLLFIDEIDSFGSRAIHDSQHSDYKRQVINGLIECLDGFERRAGVVVIGATNHPENLDSAIIRPGRLDRHIVLTLPDEEARRRIFEHYAGIDIPPSERAKFAKSTAGMSGASIERMIRDAKRIARRKNETLDIVHVMNAARPMVRVPEGHLRVAAVHETGHAIVGTVLGLAFESVSIVEDIVADGPAYLGGARFANDPFAPKTRTECFKHLSMLLGGIAAETLLFGEFDGGAVSPDSDLARATNLATRMEACFGFGDTLAVDVVAERELARLRSSDPKLRRAVQKLLREALENATSILEQNIASLHVVAQALLAQRYLPSSLVQDTLRDHSVTLGDPMVSDRFNLGPAPQKPQ